jgi:hypothetical protein
MGLQRGREHKERVYVYAVIVRFIREISFMHHVVLFLLSILVVLGDTCGMKWGNLGKIYVT